MTLDQLLVFAKVVEAGSFNGAARLLHRAQSAVSVAIRNLESEFNVTLFDREQYRPTLTPVGRALLERAQDMLGREALFIKEARQLGMGRESEVRLAVEAICPFVPVKKVLQQFARQFPDVALKLNLENLGGGNELLAQGAVDLALIESMTAADGFDVAPWAQVNFVPVASPKHSLARMSGITDEMTRDTVQIIVKSSRRFNESKDALISKTARRWVVADFPTKLDLLEDGFGWGFMPAQMVAAALKAKRLVSLRLSKAFTEFLTETPPGKPIRDSATMYLAKRTAQPIGPVTQSLWDLFLAVK